LLSNFQLPPSKASDDPSPVLQDTLLPGAKCEWSNSGLYLAVCGNAKKECPADDDQRPDDVDGEQGHGAVALKFYRPDGSLAFNVRSFGQPLSVRNERA
jgi:hypothetical protein